MSNANFCKWEDNLLTDRLKGDSFTTFDNEMKNKQIYYYSFL